MPETQKVCPNCHIKLDIYDVNCACGFNFRKSAVIAGTDAYDSNERLKDMEWLNSILRHDMRSGSNVFLADSIGLEGRSRRVMIITELIIAAVVVLLYIVYFKYSLSGLLLCVLVYLLVYVLRRYLQNRAIRNTIKLHI
jgi:hypothetical protein